MSVKDWLKTVGKLAPVILALTPLSKLAPFVVAGIQAAEQLDGATGAQKLEVAAQIVSIGVAATNAQAGQPILDQKAMDTLVKDGISAVVAATNAWIKKSKTTS